MGQTTACYRELGAELRSLRQAAGLTEAQLGRDLGWSASKVSRVETGQFHLNEVEVIHYLSFCGIVGKHCAEYRAMAREAEPKLGYWLRQHDLGLPEATRSLIYHETTASASTSYEPEFIPGLLQTEGYIRAFHAERLPTHDADVAVQIRKERQRILSRPQPAQFTFFVHEHAIMLAVGGDHVMHEQLLALLLFDGMPNIEIRLVPFSAGAQTVCGGAFRVFQFAQHQPLVYLDGLICGLFLEDREYVDRYRDLVLTIADVAYDERESREYFADLANDYDRERAQQDVHDRVAEEQLQPGRH